MARVEVYEITNTSQQLVTFGYSAINPTQSIGVIDPRTAGILKLAGGSSTTIEAQRTERGELEEIQRLGLIRFESRFVSRPDIPQPSCFGYVDQTFFIGYPILLVPSNVDTGISYWSVQGLPAGWSFNSQTGVISAPAQATPADYNIVVSTVNTDNLVCTVNYTVRVEIPGVLDLDILTTAPSETFDMTSACMNADLINCYINWGDGTTTYASQVSDLTHVYATPGNYNIRVEGELSHFEGFMDILFNGGASMVKVQAVNLVQGNGIRVFNQAGALNSTTIPVLDSPTLESLLDLFIFCLGFGPTPFPVGIFDNVPNLRIARRSLTFGFIATFTGSIPAGLFNNCPLIDDVADCFDGNFGLTGAIPVTLFDNLPLLRIANGVFRSCSSLTGSVQPMFNNNPLLEEALLLYSGCNNITGPIPGNYFDNNPLLRAGGFGGAFGAGPALSGSTIPANVFANNPLLEDVVSAFSAPGITGPIPSNLFDNNPLLRRVDSAFAFSGISGTVPAALFANNPNLERARIPFRESSIADPLPAGLYGSQPRMIDAAGQFSEPGVSSNLGTTVPATLLAGMPNVEDVVAMVASNPYVTSVPAGFLDNNPNVTTVRSFFFRATNVAFTTFPPDLFDNCPLINDARDMFEDTNFTPATVDAFLISLDTFNTATGVRNFGYDAMTSNAHLDINRSGPGLAAKNSLITKGWILIGTY